MFTIPEPQAPAVWPGGGSRLGGGGVRFHPHSRKLLTEHTGPVNGRDSLCSAPARGRAPARAPPWASGCRRPGAACGRRWLGARGPPGCGPCCCWPLCSVTRVPATPCARRRGRSVPVFLEFLLLPAQSSLCGQVMRPDEGVKSAGDSVCRGLRVIPGGSRQRASRRRASPGSRRPRLRPSDGAEGGNEEATERAGSDLRVSGHLDSVLCAWGPTEGFQLDHGAI